MTDLKLDWSSQWRDRLGCDNPDDRRGRLPHGSIPDDRRGRLPHFRSAPSREVSSLNGPTPPAASGLSTDHEKR